MADDLRKIQGAPGAASAPGRDDAKPAAPASPSAPGALKPDFLAGLDAFSRKLDEEQKAHERAEAEQRRRREEEEARRKVEAERARHAQAEAQRKAEAEKQGEGRRFSALEMLRKQAATRPADDAARRRVLAKPLISKALLSTLHFLAEFAKETNAVLPTTEGSYGFIYLEQGPPMVLSNAFADYRARKLDGDEVCDHVFLLYHARYAQPAALSVAGPDIEHCRRFLALSRVPFEFSATRKNDFGQALSGTFTLSGPIPCELYVRADYDAPGVVIELLNVGRLGAGRCLLAPEAFNESLVDEIAKHALGSKNEFAKLVS
jgi:hypothetical protein